VKSFRWTAAEVRRALGQADDAADLVFAGVSTDTRKVGTGDLFVALRGDRFDGHGYLTQAAEAGAVGAVVDSVPDNAPAGLAYFVVPNTLHALGALGRHRRRALTARVVGVVGSNGKTTTKDLIRVVLSAKYRTHATEGNLNNQIGVPLTLLATPDDAEVLVVEMGTNEPGEIEILTRIVDPDAAIVTSIGEEHLEKLGDLEGVLNEEIAILRELRPGGLALVAEEPAVLPDLARELVHDGVVRVAGFSAAADLRPDGGGDGDSVMLEADGGTRWSWRGHAVHLPLPGRWNVRNALLALGLADAWGVPPADAAAALSTVPRPKLRGEWKRIGGVRLLADCYNSNPPSAAASLELLATLPREGPRIAVLGTMRELGAAADELHRRTADAAAERIGTGIDLIVATGAFVAAFEPLADRLGSALVLCSDPVGAYDRTAPSLNGTETILLKASRGEALERWIPLLERDFGGG
jgi:UDP-N-acetylmuramoyl-tripeptide--D-alanyl-D-alanine ligase